MPKVKAAVLERSRRSTAGKRMQSLMGKAQEDDDAFWSHSIWSEGGGGFSSGRKRRRGDDDDDDTSSSSDSGSDSSDSMSDGEGSFRMSDEESDAAVDQFDSDFDESESEDEEEGGEGATERELIAEEKRRKAAQKKKRQQMAFQGKGSSGGRELMKKKKGQMTKRGPTGEGWNAGLVLNWPAPSSSVELGRAAVTKPAAIAQPSAPISAPVEVSSVNSSLPAQQSPSKPQHAQVTKPTTSAPKTAQQTSPIATKTRSKPVAKSTAVPQHNLRGGTSKSEPKPAAPSKVKQPQRPAVIDKKTTTQKPRISQEELIIEAIKSTEMENAKWLSTRKRVKEEAAHRENAATSKTVTHNPVSRFHSRRGCNNTLTFMDMDHLPDILTRSQPRKTSVTDTSTTIRSPRKRRADSATSQGSTSSSPDIEKEQTKCVITGKVARYRDPKTMLGYYDLDAFKELRRRLDAGELPKKEKKKKVSTKQPAKRKATSTSGDGTSMIAKLSSNGTDVKVKIKVGNDFVPPPNQVEKKKEEAEDSTPNKPRWDDASDNLYAKSFSSSKRRRSPSSLQNDDTSQQEASQSKASSDAKGEVDSSSQNGKQVNNDAPTVQPTTSSNPPLPISSTATAAAPGQPGNGAAVKPEGGEAAASTKKSNAVLKPTSAELNTFMQAWISRPENKNNLMPSLQQKQQIMEELGVDKKRLEGWFYRTRKKMKQDNPPDKTSSLDTKSALPQVMATGNVVAGVPSNSEVKAEPQLETTVVNQVDKPAEKEVESSRNDQNVNSEPKSTTSTSQSCETGNERNLNSKPNAVDKGDTNDAQIPLLPTNGSKKCEQTPSKQIQNIILEQSKIQTT